MIRTVFPTVCLLSTAAEKCSAVDTAAGIPAAVIATAMERSTNPFEIMDLISRYLSDTYLDDGYSSGLESGVSSGGVSVGFFTTYLMTMNTPAPIQASTTTASTIYSAMFDPLFCSSADVPGSLISPACVEAVVLLLEDGAGAVEFSALLSPFVVVVGAGVVGSVVVVVGRSSLMFATTNDVE